MDTGKQVSRLSKIARDLNVGIATIVEFLNKQGIKMTPDPNAKIDAEAQVLLEKQFRKDHDAKVEADMHRPGRLKRDTITIEDVHPHDHKAPAEDFEDDSFTITDNSLHHKEIKHHEPQAKVAKPEITQTPVPEKPAIKVIGSVDLDNLSPKPKTTEPVIPPAKAEQPEEKEVTPVKETAPIAPPTEQIVAEKIPVTEDQKPAQEPEKAESAPEMISNVTQLESSINIVGKIDLEATKAIDKNKKEAILTKKKHVSPKAPEGKPVKPGREGKHREDPLEEIFPDLADAPDEIFKHAR
ncbi:MAG: hypothetical protein WCP08_03600, partial [Prolixibacteraceae bacterium]